MRRRPSRVPDEAMSQEMRRFLDELDRKIPLHNLAATTAPGVGDDEDDGYEISSRWINVSADDEYVCLDATAGAAVWKKSTP